jgi:hypothetical protein
LWQDENDELLAKDTSGLPEIITVPVSEGSVSRNASTQHAGNSFLTPTPNGSSLMRRMTCRVELLEAWIMCMRKARDYKEPEEQRKSDEHRRHSKPNKRKF